MNNENYNDTQSMFNDLVLDESTHNPIKLFSPLSALIERDYRVITTTNNLSERCLDARLIAIENKLLFDWNLNPCYVF